MSQHEQNGHPALSIVATARNDDHGGDLLGRMQWFVDCLDALCERHRLAAELVLVEWNPPADRAPLSEALRWPRSHRACGVRIITVPHEVHRRFKHSEALPLFQMIAKNAGIRRARGDYVLASNVDVLFSDELVRFLASGSLRSGRLYRAERCDVPATPPDVPSVDALLAWCAGNVIRVNARDATINLVTGDRHTIYVPGTRRARLHTNACGDFQLMAARHWWELRGYPEFETYSMHLDSVLSFMAHFGGAREEVLPDPMRVYHFEHAGGWTPDAARTKTLDTRLEKAGIPQLAHATFDAWAREMTRSEQPIIFNDEDWGLANDELDEEHVVRASWEAETANASPGETATAGLARRGENEE